MAAIPAWAATRSKAPTPCAADAAGLYRAAAVGTTQIRMARPAAGVTRGSLDHRGQARLVAGLELATPVEHDRAAHPGGAGSSGGVTFLIGRGGSSRGPRIRLTSVVTRSGAAMKGATQAMIRIGMRNRAASGRIARKNARAQTQTAYSADDPPGHPRQVEAASGQQHHQCEDEADGQVQGIQHHALMVGPAARHRETGPRTGRRALAATLAP